MLYEVIAVTTIILFGIIFIILSVIFSFGFLVEREAFCSIFNWHSYKKSDDYHEQAEVCEYCYKIKWH